MRGILVQEIKAFAIVHDASSKLSVRDTDSLQEALDKMLDYEQDVLPVLNSQGEIIGDLRLSEVLSQALIHGRDLCGMED